MRMLKLRAVIGASIAAALLATGATGASAAVNTSRQSRTIVGVGSDNTYEFHNDLNEVYNESPGCAVIPDITTSFTNYQQLCIDGGQLTYSKSYSGLIETENLYHDRAVEAFPVGSGNGRKVLEQAVAGNPALAADYLRSSSKQSTFALPSGKTAYGVAYGRGAAGYWIGKNNTLVKRNAAGTPTPNLSVAQLNGIFVGNASGDCLVNYSTNALSSVGTGFGAPGSGTVNPIATQAGSGTGTGFARLITGNSALSSAAVLQNCIPAAFKDGTGDGSRVLFENNASPICQLNLRSSAIYPYEFARFVQNKGGTVACAGVMGKVSATTGVAGVAPTVTSIGKLPGTVGAFPLGSYRYVYVVTDSNSGSFDINDPGTWTGQTQAVLNMWHPVYGWACKTSHAIDPITGLNYRDLITNVFKADGFAPIPSGSVGGATFSGTSYCRDAATT
jgi:hypothetical protein